MKTMGFSILAILGVLICVVLIRFAFMSAQSRDFKIERFAPCPDKPNCVSTRAPAGDSHAIEPLTLTKSTADAKTILRSEILNLPRTKLAEDDRNYLRFEFQTLIFRFIDDVEFQFDEESRTLHFRSASRVGHSDLGVNRKRMEEIRSLVQGKI